MTGYTLTDCHCHLQDNRFDSDLPEVMARAELVGVNRFVCNASAPSDWEKTVHIAKNSPNVWPCLGLHPLHLVTSGQWPVTRAEWIDHLAEMIEVASRELAQAVGIGEIGIDRYITPRDDALQESVFREQLRLASRLGKPVMLHTRHSLDRILEILSEKQVDIPVFLLHGFGSSTERVDKIVNMGGYFSFSANILKNYHKKARQAAATVPLDRVLLESDAPDMPPPQFYPRNEPMVLPTVLAELARLRGMPIDELAAVIAKNEAVFFEKW
ncbi:MAG: TatD family hydrolase [Planctomycetaceae bacterium]|nr:TatD family hydrolase [Planctomycetaceae bacterium]